MPAPVLDFQQIYTLVALDRAVRAAEQNPRRGDRVTPEDVAAAMVPENTAKSDRRFRLALEQARYALHELSEFGLAERHVYPGNGVSRYAITDEGRSEAARARDSAPTSAEAAAQMKWQARHEAAGKVVERVRADIRRVTVEILKAADGDDPAALIADDGRTIAGELEDHIAHLRSALIVYQEAKPQA